MATLYSADRIATKTALLRTSLLEGRHLLSLEVSKRPECLARVCVVGTPFTVTARKAREEDGSSISLRFTARFRIHTSLSHTRYPRGAANGSDLSPECASCQADGICAGREVFHAGLTCRATVFTQLRSRPSPPDTSCNL
ncbi:hypothetical protein Bbelb_244440 [Branchiostoma belcheri]|nr:hypothetical protein Bbelb_244440 [Branchiostoma belcheri]